jgi:hypothetical protein
MENSEDDYNAFVAVDKIRENNLADVGEISGPLQEERQSYFSDDKIPLDRIAEVNNSMFEDVPRAVDLEHVESEKLPVSIVKKGAAAREEEDDVRSVFTTSGGSRAPIFNTQKSAWIWCKRAHMKLVVRNDGEELKLEGNYSRSSSLEELRDYADELVDLDDTLEINLFTKRVAFGIVGASQGLENGASKLRGLGGFWSKVVPPLDELTDNQINAMPEYKACIMGMDRSVIDKIKNMNPMAKIALLYAWTLASTIFSNLKSADKPQYEDPESGGTSDFMKRSMASMSQKMLDNLEKPANSEKMRNLDMTDSNVMKEVMSSMDLPGMMKEVVSTFRESHMSQKTEPAAAPVAPQAEVPEPNVVDIDTITEEVEPPPSPPPPTQKKSISDSGMIEFDMN